MEERRGGGGQDRWRTRFAARHAAAPCARHDCARRAIAAKRPDAICFARVVLPAGAERAAQQHSSAAVLNDFRICVCVFVCVCFCVLFVCVRARVYVRGVTHTNTVSHVYLLLIGVRSVASFIVVCA